VDFLFPYHLTDNGFQLLASAMVTDQTLQVYETCSKGYGQSGDPDDARLGVN
jgi:hypothetical protein